MGLRTRLWDRTSRSNGSEDLAIKPLMGDIAVLTVDHGILVDKMEFFGISGIEHD